MQTSSRGDFRSRYGQGAALIRVGGPVTLSTMRALRMEIVAGLMTHAVDRVLCDFSAAVIMLGDEQWHTYACENASPHVIHLPLGLLVGAEGIAGARAHCDHLNARGRICLAFMASKAAYRWLGVPALQFPQRAGEVAPG